MELVFLVAINLIVILIMLAVVMGWYFGIFSLLEYIDKRFSQWRAGKHDRHNTNTPTS